LFRRERRLIKWIGNHVFSPGTVIDCMGRF
jgi:hypothetical protein